MIESLIMTQFELRARLTQLNFSILISTYASCEMCLELCNLPYSLKKEHDMKVNPEKYKTPEELMK